MAQAYTEKEVALASLYAQLTELKESSNDLLNYVDMADATTFSGESGLNTIGGWPQNYGVAYAQAMQRPSATACYFITWDQHKLIRAASRAFCSLNPYWMAVAENKINYAVGSGHVRTVVPRKKGEKLPESLAEKVAEELDGFCKLNQYRLRQGEKITRLDRDGEFFLRYRENHPDGILRVRFVEPILVRNPPGKMEANGVWFGIQYADEDYEEPLRFYIQPATYDGGMTQDMQAIWEEGVDAEEIQYRKANVDLGSPRGVPSTYRLKDSCTQAVSTLKSMGRLVDIRARIAMIRKQVNATAAQIAPLLAGNRLGQASRQGKMLNAFGFPYGTVIDTNDQRTFEFPSQNIETDKIVASLKADLQAVAAAVGLADFTISGDSGAAFANALIKEGPMDRAMTRLQQELIDDDTEVYERAIALAAKRGRLPSDVLKKVRIEILPPGVIARERLVNKQADEILVRNGAMSPDTMAMRDGLDPDDERARIKANPPAILAGSPTGAGDTRSTQPKQGGASTGARGVPRGAEAGPKANSTASTNEGIEEGSYNDHSKDKPTGEDERMSAMLLTPAWEAATQQEILGLPQSAGAPRDWGIRSDYEPGVQGVYLGVVDGQKVWAVDAQALMVKYQTGDFIVRGNHVVHSFVPEDVIFVDWAYPPADMAADIYHEVVEVALMSRGGWAYARAHRVAIAKEREFLLKLRPELAALQPQA